MVAALVLLLLGRMFDDEGHAGRDSKSVVRVLRNVKETFALLLPEMEPVSETARHPASRNTR